jgi:hypothetical protein
MQNKDATTAAKSWDPTQCDAVRSSIAVKPAPSKRNEARIVEGAPIPPRPSQSLSNRKNEDS